MPLPDHLARFAEPKKVLDHGFVRLVEVMGDDTRIEEAARQSYDAGDKAGRDPTATRALIRYLTRHRHTTPREACCITLDVKMPIFVARQLVRHRTQAISEVSARYTELPAEFYVPEPDQVCFQSTDSKQGRSGPLGEADAFEFREELRNASSLAFDQYKNDCEFGVARETARIGLPLGTYTKWWSTINLHNLLHMCSLRLDPHAQWEVRQFAEAIAEIVKAWVPFAWEAFEDYQLFAVTLSRHEAELVRELVRIGVDVLRAQGEPDGDARAVMRELFDRYGVETKRERGDFLKRFGIE